MTRPTYGEPLPAGPTPRAMAGLFGVAALVGAVLAPLVGWLWVQLADPPTAPLGSNGGVFLGEQGLNQQSGVTLWFFVLGLGVGAAAGLAVGWFGQRFGWLTVLAVLLLCVIGSLGSAYLGIHVFGPDPRAEAAGAKVGHLIQLSVSLDTRVAYLGWPIGGLLGALAAIAGWSRVETLPGPSATPTPASVAEPAPDGTSAPYGARGPSVTSAPYGSADPVDPASSAGSSSPPG